MNYTEWIHTFMNTFLSWLGAGLAIDLTIVAMLWPILMIIAWIGRRK